MTDSEAFQQWVEDLAVEDHMIVFQRACVSLGTPHRLGDDGAIEIPEDFDDQDPDFQLAMHMQYVHMYWQDAIDELLEDGLVAPDGVNEDGTVNYVVVAT